MEAIILATGVKSKVFKVLLNLVLYILVFNLIIDIGVSNLFDLVELLFVPQKKLLFDGLLGLLYEQPFKRLLIEYIFLGVALRFGTLIILPFKHAFKLILFLRFYRFEQACLLS